MEWTLDKPSEFFVKTDFSFKVIQENKTKT